MKDLDFRLLQSVIDAKVDISEQAQALFDIAVRCDRVTEFGSRYGDSGKVFLAAEVKSLVCYDLVDLCAGKILKEMADSKGIDFQYIIADTSKVQIEPTDLLFLDTVHNVKQILAELQNAAQVGKFLVFHDSNEVEVERAILNFLLDNSDWVFHSRVKEGVGLAVLSRLRK